MKRKKTKAKRKKAVKRPKAPDVIYCIATILTDCLHELRRIGDMLAFDQTNNPKIKPPPPQDKDFEQDLEGTDND